MELDIKSVFHTISLSGDEYIFFEGHPVDVNNRKYDIFRKWSEKGKLKCIICGKSPSHFNLTRCKGAGSIHSSGLPKHHLRLVCSDNTEITLDHWIPNWFLKRHHSIIEISDNLVPMCQACNQKKASALPVYNVWKNIFHSSIIQYRN